MSASALAQQYRWVKGGGSSCIGTTSDDFDQITRMCADRNTNIYAIAMVGGQNVFADTFSVMSRHYASGACNSRSTLFVSYNCSGQMRWAKMFDTYGTMKVLDMVYDEASSIYMVGWSAFGYTKYYTDTTVTNPNYSMFLMKYDTSGKFQWIRYLGANNAANQLMTWGLAAAVGVDPQGNPHHFANCKTGMELSPTLTAQAGTYDVKYSPSGTLISAMRLPLDSIWAINHVIFAPSGNY